MFYSLRTEKGQFFHAHNQYYTCIGMYNLLLQKVNIPANWYVHSGSMRLLAEVFMHLVRADIDKKGFFITLNGVIKPLLITNSNDIAALIDRFPNLADKRTPQQPPQQHSEYICRYHTELQDKYITALADAIHRPLGVIPDSAIGLVSQYEMSLAAARWADAISEQRPIESTNYGRNDLAGDFATGKNGT